MLTKTKFNRILTNMIAAIALLTAYEVRAAETDWRHFRGTDSDGITDAVLPTDLGTDESDVWVTELPGVGWSSPVIADGKIWMTAATTREATAEEIAAKLKDVQFAQIKTAAGEINLFALCVDAESGELLKTIPLATVDDPDPINPMNSYASPTPAVEGDKVVFNFGSYGTWCFDTNTYEKLWETKFEIDHSVGPGSSPIIADGKVLLVCDGLDQQYVVAVALEDGSKVWKTDRPPIDAQNGEFKKAYSTPFLVDSDNGMTAIIPGAQWTAAYDVASGDELYRVNCGSGFSTTPMATVAGDMVVTSTGYGQAELIGFNPKGRGDITSSIAWRFSSAVPTMPSFLVNDGLIYMIADQGILTVVDSADGARKDRLRIGGNFSASPVLSNNHLYLSSREGMVTVVNIDGKLEKLSERNFGESILASPAVYGNDLIIRTQSRLHRISN